MVQATALDLILSRPISDDTAYVYFDLETTGLFNSDEVIQIAAICGPDTYNAYIMPGHVPEEITLLTGFSKVDGKLLLRDQVLETVSQNEAWVGFVNFLFSLGKKIVLVAHYVYFDLRFMIRDTGYENLTSHINSLVCGFVDTIAVYKAQLPGRESYKQKDVAADLAVQVGTPHNGIDDVLTMRAICDAVPAFHFKTFTKSFDEYIKKKERATRAKQIKAAFGPLKDAGISGGIVNKIDAAGITLAALHETYAEASSPGVRHLLSEEVAKKPRVTKNPAIIDAIVKYLYERNEKMSTSLSHQTIA